MRSSFHLDKPQLDSVPARLENSFRKEMYS
jgi:hypothetical protein